MDKAQIKAFIAARVAKELKDGDVVNLGIGLPTLVPAYLPENVHVILQSENGTIGTGPVTDENRDPFHVVDAGGSPSAAAPGACFIDSASSFALIRGGHVDATILGGLEVDEEGSLCKLDHPRQKNARHGRRNGFARRRKERYRCNGTHRKGQAQNP